MNQIEKCVEEWTGYSEYYNDEKVQELVKMLNKVAIQKDDIIHGFLFDDGIIAMSPDVLTRDFIHKDAIQEHFFKGIKNPVIIDGEDFIPKEILREKIDGDKIYPKDIFRELSKGELIRLHSLLKEHGFTLDIISANACRRVLNNIKEDLLNSEEET